MSGLDCDITLTWNDDPLDPAWEGEGTCCVQFWQLKLTCPNPTTNKAVLSIVVGCIDSDTVNTGPDYINQGVRYSDDTSSCNPLNLIFGIFNVGALDFTCQCGGATSGTFLIEVTV